jgi:hypothetical protein
VVGQNNSNQVIGMLTISEPCELKTSRRIGIGSNMEEVKSAYKVAIDPSSSDSETIVAGSVYGGIIFKMENNKVKSIFIGASAE